MCIDTQVEWLYVSINWPSTRGCVMNLTDLDPRRNVHGRNLDEFWAIAKRGAFFWKTVILGKSSVDSEVRKSSETFILIDWRRMFFRESEKKFIEKLSRDFPNYFRVCFQAHPMKHFLAKPFLVKLLQRNLSGETFGSNERLIIMMSNSKAHSLMTLNSLEGFEMLLLALSYWWVFAKSRAILNASWLPA